MKHTQPSPASSSAGFGSVEAVRAAGVTMMPEPMQAEACLLLAERGLGLSVIGEATGLRVELAASLMRKPPAPFRHFTERSNFPKGEGEV